MCVIGDAGHWPQYVLAAATPRLGLEGARQEHEGTVSSLKITIEHSRYLLREREGGRAKGEKGGRKGAGTLGETMVVALEGVRVLART